MGGFKLQLQKFRSESYDKILSKLGVISQQEDGFSMTASFFLSFFFIQHENKSQTNGKIINYNISYIANYIIIESR